MLGLNFVDTLVVLGYLLGITVLGVWMARKVHNIGDYFMPRRFGKAMMLTHTFGTGTHSDQAVSVSSKTFAVGLSGIWYQWLWLVVTPFYWLIAPVMRRFRAITTADVFDLRYGGSVAGLFAVVGSVNLMINIGVMLKGSGEVLAAISGGEVSSEFAIILMTVLFVVYGIAGGLGAAIVTDFVQGILTVVFSFLLLPFVFSTVGGLDGIRENISNSEQMFSLVAPAQIGIFYIAVIALNGLIGLVTQPHTMGNCAAGRTEMDGQVGFMGGAFLKRICSMAWCLTGLAAVAYFAGTEIHPDQIYGRIARDFLPAILPGFLGLFIATLLASVMSSCDSFMIASSALFTENLYKRVFSDRSQGHYILVGRITGFFVVVGGVVFAFWLPNVIKGLEIFWKIPPMMGIAFWLGLFWRRGTTAGAWAATLLGFGALFLSEQSFFVSFVESFPRFFDLPWVVESHGAKAMYLPWQMVFYLSVGSAGAIIVSLLTRPVSENKLERFYALTRTPVSPGEKIEEPCTLPANAKTLPSRKLLPFFNLEIQIPARNSVIGFSVGWVLVIGLILFFLAVTGTL